MYSQKTVHNVMTELFQSGTLTKRIKGWETLYSLRAKEWHPLLSQDQLEVQWLDWKEIYSFLIAVWTILDDSRYQNEDDSLVLSELLLLLTREIPRLPEFLSAPLEDALHGSDRARVCLPSVCDAVEKFIHTLIG